MSDISQIERAIAERLVEVRAQLDELDAERDRLRRALRALRDEAAPAVACPARPALDAPPWQGDRLRR
jgi:cell division protein FtsB